MDMRRSYTRACKEISKTYLLDFYTTPSGPVRTLEAPVSESCK